LKKERSFSLEKLLKKENYKTGDVAKNLKLCKEQIGTAPIMSFRKK